MKHEIVVLPDGTVDIELDPLTTKLISIEQENIKATNFIIDNGYDGDQSECPALKIPSTRLSVTVPGSRERQDKILKASNTGMYFLFTKGFIIRCNDSLITQQRATYMEVKDFLLAFQEDTGELTQDQGRCIGSHWGAKERQEYRCLQGGGFQEDHYTPSKIVLQMEA